MLLVHRGLAHLLEAPLSDIRLVFIAANVVLLSVGLPTRLLLLITFFVFDAITLDLRLIYFNRFFDGLLSSYMDS